jgi:hypothetical protein
MVFRFLTGLGLGGVGPNAVSVRGLHPIDGMDDIHL